MEFALVLLVVSTVCNIRAHVFDSTLGHIKSSAPNGIQSLAVKNLIHRLVGDTANNFVITVDSSFSDVPGKETFAVFKTSSGYIQINATTGVAAATGFHYYLKYLCICHVSWQTEQLNLPEELPDVDIRMTMNDRFRYYQNVCTTSYSFVWWDWKQWEKHIDWMALNSFNLVLAFNGQEAIWQRVYRALNLTQDEINEHLGGPAFLSWSRMGNIRGWGGPLPQSWHQRSLVLQKQILARMRELGIIPVLPAFAGHVPRAFKRLFPEANLTETECWNKFNGSYCCPYLLDPTDKLFRKVGSLFLHELTAEFGTNHVYNCDTFNEMLPPSGSLDYLRNVGKGIYAAMTDEDANAIWLMQNWLFVNVSFWSIPRIKALLKSVPQGKMIVLDLHSEQFPQYNRLQQYFGQPYIWCMLHNFGGTLGMFGSLDIINERTFSARTSENSTMIGTGVTPEGINQNYIVYDLMSEMAYRSEPVKIDPFIDHYIYRRYGDFDNNVSNGWQILKRTVYNFTGLQNIRGKYAISRSPSFNINTWKWYDSNDLFRAWDLFLSTADTYQNKSGYLHDLVDLTRQVLQVLGDEYYRELRDAFKVKDPEAFSDASSIFLEVFDDLEDILATNEAFLLGKWLNDAKKAVTNEDEAKLYEYNARNQITLWGPKGEITDYANKQWAGDTIEFFVMLPLLVGAIVAGVISYYFLPRWKQFIAYANQTLTKRVPFNKTLIKSRIFLEVEEPFTFDRTIFPTQAQGNTIQIARKIHAKWIKRIHSRPLRSTDDYWEASAEATYLNEGITPTVTIIH